MVCAYGVCAGELHGPHAYTAWGCAGQLASLEVSTGVDVEDMEEEEVDARMQHAYFIGNEVGMPMK